MNLFGQKLKRLFLLFTSALYLLVWTTFLKVTLMLFTPTQNYVMQLIGQYQTSSCCLLVRWPMFSLFCFSQDWVFVLIPYKVAAKSFSYISFSHWLTFKLFSWFPCYLYSFLQSSWCYIHLHSACDFTGKES